MDAQALMWFKSTRSNGSGGDCVEVAATPSVILVRDSKDPDGPRLAFDRASWRTFVDGLKVD